MTSFPVAPEAVAGSAASLSTDPLTLADLLRVANAPGFERWQEQVRRTGGCDPRKVKPWSVDRVMAVRAALPDRYRVLVEPAAGCGLRQGEVFGLAIEDVDFLGGGVVHVARQVKLLRNRPVFAPPKGGKERDVPLPESVAEALRAHIAQYPAREVTLPWKDLNGPLVTATLILYGPEGLALNRNRFNHRVWKPTLEAAGVPMIRDNGTHALRHFYASVLLDAGESIKALSEYLGHHDPGFTLRTYTHLMPASETRTRAAVDGVFRGRGEASRP
ncbi:site-specific integrase [Streptomyces sp. AM 2-1-1]|uniref:tyrosine-type recombinase/integrase n=1 Tax=Streptomyces sp. AM 2-1-1 TaxID=3028709 RepID=UPI0023B8AFC7|nr:site-specific integrase [Streptomyces sp. AM 2-1-1]WEH39451.1 site-specific integrase [Streptomyces sp. AM 2-1-1]